MENGEKIKTLTNLIEEKNAKNIPNFLGTLGIMETNNLEILENYGIVIRRCRELKILTIDSLELKHTLEVAKNMRFIEAYKQNPCRLCFPSEYVIKIMSYCDAHRIPYIKDGIYNDFLFNYKCYVKVENNVGNDAINSKENEYGYNNLGWVA